MSDNTKAYWRFNLNTVVLVRMTEYGKKLHREHYDQLVKDGLPKDVEYRFVENAEGHSAWQLGTLMAIFGEHIERCVTKDNQIFTDFEILIPTDQLKEHAFIRPPKLITH